ncbi:1,5-anhydro-D-fructose reductase isoform X4 [Chiloscyllium punctatum]|uniref:1,5-anhydro-D-fructose reductase isoform X4 n=2 Tax=Chiloscyllium TaxID=34767 RepID=UPI003B63E2B2
MVISSSSKLIFFRIAMPRCVEVIIIGAGNRGQTYAFFSKDFPERMKVVGVADCRLIARQNLQMKYSIQDCNIFSDWREAAKREKFADAVIIATPDRHHKDPTVAFAKKGYHILLEKPMAVTVDDCKEIVLVCKENNVILAVCHVLRYSPPILKVHPEGAADRCLDCAVEKCCPYSAKKLYLEGVKNGKKGWPISVICEGSTVDIESVTKALREGPYGRCVYECDNDVVTHQVVNMEFEEGVTAAFTMVAFTEKLASRKITIYGTEGELSSEGQDPVTVFDFLTQTKTEYPLDYSSIQNTHLGGHGGADYYLMDSFIQAVAENNPSLIRTGPEETLLSHLLVFDAERSRRENRVVFCANTE